VELGFKTPADHAPILTRPRVASHGKRWVFVLTNMPGNLRKAEELTPLDAIRQLGRQYNGSYVDGGLIGVM